MKTYSSTRKAALLLGALSLVFVTGCATNRSLYYWGNYPNASYAWLKEEPEDGGELFNAMVEDVDAAISKDHALPPGFYAHFGLLYMQSGQFDKAVEYWEMEKVAFPESTPFMDFLLQSIQGTRLNTGAAREMPIQNSEEEAAK